MTPLSDRAVAAWRFISRCAQTPTRKEIAAFVGCSAGAAHNAVRELVAYGVIEVTPRAWRGIVLLQSYQRGGTMLAAARHRTTFPAWHRGDDHPDALKQRLAFYAACDAALERAKLRRLRRAS